MIKVARSSFLKWLNADFEHGNSGSKCLAKIVYIFQHICRQNLFKTYSKIIDDHSSLFRTQLATVAIATKIQFQNGRQREFNRVYIANEFVE